MERNNNKKQQEAQNDKVIDLNKLIGQFGPYQFNVMMFTFIREGTVAIDSIALSLALHPDIDFQCIPQSNSSRTRDFELKCDHQHNNGSISRCHDWHFPDPSLDETLTVEYDLICDRKMLGSLLMTSYFFGMLFGKLFWGQIADKFGRWNAHSLCHVMAFLFSSASLISPSIYLLMLLRFGTAFGATGFTILNTLQVEMIGTKYRMFATTANHLGWGMGIILLAFIGVQTNSWRVISAICPVMMLIGLPWLLILPESIRWLKVHGKHEAARKEIKRAARYNFLKHGRDCEFDSKIDKYLNTMDDTKPLKQEHQEASVLDLFKHPLFCFNLITLWLTTIFNNFIYYTRTIHFSKDRKSIFANFIISGSSEILCLVISLAFMMMFKRRTCIALFICMTGFTYLAEALIATFTDLMVKSFALFAILDGVIKISSINGIIVLFLVAYEVFPTELRERGSSIIMTAVAFGGVIAPFTPKIIELVGGRLNNGIMIATISFVLASFIGLLVTETKDVDVTDTIKESTDQQQLNNNGKKSRTTSSNGDIEAE